MGLDTVELLVEIEDTFGITVPDEEAARVVTVGDLVATVCGLLAGLPNDRCKTQRVFYRIRRSLWQGDRAGLKPSTRLRSVIKDDRAYRELEAFSGLRFPALLVPTWYRRLLNSSIIIAFLMLASAAWLGWPWAVAAVGLLVLTTDLNHRFDPTFRKVVPEESVRKFMYRLTARNFAVISPEGYSEAEVYEVVKRIVVDKAGVDPLKVHPGATINNDLGMD